MSSFPPGYHSPTVRILTHEEVEDAFDQILEESSAFPDIPEAMRKTDRQLLEESLVVQKEILAELKKLNEKT